jgi:hypothetical protein
MRKLLLTAAILIAAAFPHFTKAQGCDGAGNCYVRAAASGAGTGADWTNAYTGFGTGTGQVNPNSLTRGVTYYVAGGSYNTTTRTTFTIADFRHDDRDPPSADDRQPRHGDWLESNAYQAQAVFGPIDMESDYFIWNGVYRGSGTGLPATDWRTGYGFKILNSAGGGVPINGCGFFIGVYPATDGNNVVVEYTEIQGSGNFLGTQDDAAICDNDGQNPTLEYSYMHDTGGGTLGFDEVGTVNIFYNWFQNDQSTPSVHGEGFALRGPMTLNVGFNYLENEEGTAYLGTPCPNEGCNTGRGAWSFYGNVFFSNQSEFNGQNSTIYNITSVTPSGSNAIYTGTFVTPPNGTPASSFVGGKFWVTGCSNSANNIAEDFPVVAVAATATTLTLPNSSAVAASGQSCVAGIQDGLSYAIMQFFGSSSSPSSWTGLNFWNNTVYQIGGTSAACELVNAGNVASTTLVFQNNLMVNCSQSGPPGNGGITSETYDYNSYFSVTSVGDTGTGVQKVTSGTPFVAPSTNNFVLSFDTSAWTSLSSPYNVDIVGMTRTSSRGAFQFAGAVTLTPASYTFASTAVGSTSSDSPVTFTLTNNTGVTVMGITISFTGAAPGDFTDTTSCGTTLASSASCQIFVTFTPTATGTRTATLSVSDSASSSPQTSSLSGTAIPSAINPSPANPVTFGVAVTDPSIPSTVKNEKRSENPSAYGLDRAVLVRFLHQDRARDAAGSSASQ